MPTIEGLRLKFRNKIYIPFTCKKRSRQLINKEFTIISNNCWSGTVYEAYNLQKQSPTVGVFFMAEDYIKFVSDLKGYLSAKLIFINPDESRWKSFASSNSRFGQYPVGVLRDIEIHFLHYHSEQEAQEKWCRRVERIHWDHLLVKFNDQNKCTQKEVEVFCQLPYEHKIFFTCNRWDVDSDIIKMLPQHSNVEHVLASYEPFGKAKSVDITKLINSL